MTMMDVVATNPNEMRELTIDELDEAGGGILPFLVVHIAVGAAVATAWWLASL